MTTPTCSILLVGGTPAHTDWLHSVRQARPAPALSFQQVGSVEAAVAQLEQAPCCAVLVHDQQSEEVPALTESLRAKHLNTLVALVNDRTDVTGSVAQLDLSTKDEPRATHDLLARAMRLSTVLNHEAVRALVDTDGELPTAPENYQRLYAATAKDGASIKEISAIVESDPALATRTLRLANSAAFGRSRRVTSLAEAASLLGVKHIRDIAVAVYINEAFAGVPTPGFSMDHFRKSSLRIAKLARSFLPNRTDADAAFTLGLIHNTGKLVIARQRPQAFNAITERLAEENIDFPEAEQAVLGTTHAEAGALLFQAWGLPMTLVEATAFHHQPSRETTCSNPVLAAVHAADALFGIVVCGEPESKLDRAYLEGCGLADQIPAWRAKVEAAEDDLLD